MLAVAIAEGTCHRQMGANNDVPERTAYRWATEPEVRAEVASIRRRALDRGRRPDGRSCHLGRRPDPRARRDRRLRVGPAVGAAGLMSDMMAVSKFAGLEDRMTELEEQVHDASTGNAS